MDDWCVRESMCSLVSLAADLERCELWSAVERLVAGGAIERLSVPVGRGSESNRFDVSVDAQTCCPFAAFTSYVAQDAVPSLDVSNGRERDGSPIGVERALGEAAKVMPSRTTEAVRACAARPVPFTTVNRA